MKTRVIVSAVIEKDDLLLFGKKTADIWPSPNTWHLIGGGVSEDESLIDAIKREIREESRIEVEIVESIGFDEDHEPNKHGEMTHYIFLVYRARYLSGEPRADDDIVHLEWIPRTRLPEIELNRPSLKLFRKMGYI